MLYSIPFRAALLALFALSAIASEEPSVDELYLRAYEASAKKEYAAAAELYGQVIELDPQYACAFHNRARCQKRLGDPSAAKADYLSAIELVCPHVGGAHEGVASIFLKEGQVKEAYYHADMAIGLAREERMTPYLIRGDASLLLGNPDLALEDYAAALELDPNHWLPVAHRTRARFATRDIAGGLKDLFATNREMFSGSHASIVLPFAWAYLIALWIIVTWFPDRWKRMCDKETAISVRLKVLSPRAATAVARFNQGKSYRVVLALMALLFLGLTLVLVLMPFWIL